MLSSIQLSTLVILVRLDDASTESSAFYPSLCAEEQQRAARFRFDKDRHAFIASRGVLRQCLAKALNTQPSEIAFAYGDEGKPRLQTKDEGELEFNLSHTDGLVGIALGRKQPLGIDVERIRSMTDALEISRRYFSQPEAAKFATLPSAEVDAAFFRCWTRKEACVKAWGLGISEMLRRFEVGYLAGELPFYRALEPSSRAEDEIHLYDISRFDGYVGAVAVAGHPARVETRSFDSLRHFRSSF